jgi:hypothetical protein
MDVRVGIFGGIGVPAMNLRACNSDRMLLQGSVAVERVERDFAKSVNEVAHVAIQRGQAHGHSFRESANCFLMAMRFLGWQEKCRE